MLHPSLCFRFAARSRFQILHTFRNTTRLASNSAAPRRPPPTTPVTQPSRVSERLPEGWRISRTKLVEELFANNKTQLYKAPRRVTYLRLQCWGLAGLGVAFLNFFYLDKYYSAQELKRRGIEYPWLVAVGETLTALFVFIGVCFAVYRAQNHVQAIQLVKEMDTVFVRLSIRTVVPFLRTHIAVRPQNIALSKHLILPAKPPLWMLPRKDNERSVSVLIVSVMGNTYRAFFRFFWHIVDSGRRFIRGDGLISMSFTGEDAKQASIAGKYLLDIDGDWLLHEKNGKEGEVLSEFFEQ